MCSEIVDWLQRNQPSGFLFKLTTSKRVFLTMDSTETLKLETIGKHILQVTLNRPDAANAFNTQLAWDIVNVFEHLSVDTSDIRVVVVTGSGERAFCAGGDLKERNGMTDDAWYKQHLVYERMARAVLACPLPTIGAVNGAAYGGGCELACALDFIYVSENARFAQTEVRLGIIPGAGGTQTLSRAVGARRAKELILTGRTFTAQEAVQWGMANEILPQAELLPKVLATAQEIAANAPVAIRQALQAITKGTQLSLNDGLAFEIEAYNRTVTTQDRREGVLAFNEKRTPDFKGC